MISFKTFLLEGSRSHRRLLRKILSKDTSPQQVQDLTTANHYRTQFRDIIKNIKQKINSKNTDTSIFDYIKTPSSTVEKYHQLFKTMRKKYPGTDDQEDPNYEKSFHRTPPGQESTEYIPHRVFSLIHPELNRSIIAGTKKIQSVRGGEKFNIMGRDLARATLRVDSPYYISDPRKTKNKIKWRNYFE